VTRLQAQLTSASTRNPAEAPAPSELSRHHALVRALGPHAPEASRASVTKALSEQPAAGTEADSARYAGPGGNPDQLELAIALLQAGVNLDSLTPWRPTSALDQRPETAGEIAAQLELRSLLMRDSSQRTAEAAAKLAALQAQAQAKLTLRLRSPEPLTREQWAL